MIKTYKANTNVSINVVLASKKNLHITFSPLSNGNSTFTTDNEEIMNAIERHYNFGKLFRLHSTQGESKKKAPKAIEGTAPKAIEGTAPKVDEKNDETTVQDGADLQPNEGEAPAEDNATEGADNNEEGAEQTLKKVKVSDLAAAKDYLADTFGISRTALRSMKAITEQAAAHGIEFEGLS